MALQQRTPRLVAHLGERLGRPHDVGEEHGGQHPTGVRNGCRTGDEALQLGEQRLGVARVRQVVDALELHQLGAGDRRRQEAGVADVAVGVVAPLDHQRRRRDGGQKGPDVDLRVAAQEGQRRPRAGHRPFESVPPVAEFGIGGHRRSHLGEKRPLTPRLGDLPDVLLHPAVAPSPRVAVAAPGAGIGGVEDQSGDAFGTAGGEQDCHRAALGDAEHRRPIGAGGVHHRQHVVDLLVELGELGGPVGQSGSARVEPDHPGETTQPAVEVGDGRLLPHHVEVGEQPGHDHQVGTTAVYLVGDVHRAAAGVPGVGRLGGHHALPWVASRLDGHPGASES